MTSMKDFPYPRRTARVYSFDILIELYPMSRDNYLFLENIAEVDDWNESPVGSFSFTLLLLEGIRNTWPVRSLREPEDYARIENKRLLSVRMTRKYHLSRKFN